MKVFAKHSRHMENSWAYAGPPDAPEFYEEAHQAVLNTKEEKYFNFSTLIALIDEMESSADTLLNNLESNILSECKVQLEQFKRIINADRVAVKSLQNRKLESELKDLRNIISQYESIAVISEKSAVKFIDEVLDLLQ